MGESVEQFITSLYTLAENYDYGDLKDHMIRDHIVVGICDQTESERLQMDAGLPWRRQRPLYDNARLSTNSRSCSNTARRTTSRSTSCDRAFRPKVKSKVPATRSQGKPKSKITLLSTEAVANYFSKPQCADNLEQWNSHHTPLYQNGH